MGIGRTYASNTFTWLKQNERDFVGFVKPLDIGVNQADASFFVLSNALFSKAQTNVFSVGIKITKGSIVLEMDPDQLGRVGLFREEADKPEDIELVPVSEVIFTRQ
ncbi:hypothetical protein cgR_1897 [Corynebacterium glutamicum R]|uniref:Uncharacterized protein n=2 Tax=Corynebacterium glutamicum TaxID=1718 RepID=Q5KRF4_CORGT|nr:hypothetical protein [Corynebacterium glutamicum]BAF54892.1 hypothetical protein cgR_1897 [Corynebacterium glutamicum R]